MVDERDRNLPQRWRDRGPLSIFERMRQTMESMVDELDMFGRGGWGLTPTEGQSLETLGPWRLNMDLSDCGDRYELTMDLPGVDRDDVNITLHDDRLVVQGQRTVEDREERENYLRSERYFGSFSRQVPVPPDVDPEQIEAEMENGVLTLTLPKSEQRRGRQIDIT